MKAQIQEELLGMLKALADDSRLKIIQFLNEREHTVGELAQRVELTDPTVSHHLSKLRESGLVTLRTAGNQRFYRANATGLARFKQLTASVEAIGETPAAPVDDNAWIDALGWDDKATKVLREHTVNGRLVKIPAKQKKLVVVLRWLATKFEAGKMYTEPEVNAVLKSVDDEDFVLLRRELVDFGYLRRERGGGKYWLAPSEDAKASDED
jgi:DNA-binding HxlR family transcriptional regulator